MNALEQWTDTVCRSLDLDPASVDHGLLLDLTREVAHRVARPAAPLTAFLVGLAAGRDGGGAAAVKATVDTVAALLPAADVVE
jgi:hypothetical protein